MWLSCTVDLNVWNFVCDENRDINLWFSWWWLWRVMPSEMWCHVVWETHIGVSEECTACIFRLEEQASKQKVCRSSPRTVESLQMEIWNYSYILGITDS
jgi:hypothetical protein